MPHTQPSDSEQKSFPFHCATLHGREFLAITTTGNLLHRCKLSTALNHKAEAESLPRKHLCFCT